MIWKKNCLLKTKYCDKKTPKNCMKKIKLYIENHKNYTGKIKNTSTKKKQIE